MVKEIKSTLESFRSNQREAHGGGGGVAAGYGFGEERALPVHSPFPHEPPTRDPDVWPPPPPAAAPDPQKYPI